MEQEVKVIETVDVEPAKTTESITQDQVDQAIAKRVSREREAFAKKLGLEQYSDESVEQFLSSTKEKDAKLTEYETKTKQYQSDILDRDFQLTAIKQGVTNDNIDRAVKLAKIEMETNQELEMGKAFELVLDMFPMFQGKETTKVKVGDEVSKTVNEKTEIDRVLDKYKDSKYFNR